MARGVCGRGACVAGGTYDGGACIAGGVWQAACMAGGAYMAGRAWMAGETTTEAGGTHPTGMHSCFFNKICSNKDFPKWKGK